jgi:replicative DNA helicase
LSDQVAAAGNDVLFFSLEQSRLELVSKSIARTTAQRDMNNAVTSLAIRRGYLPQHVLEAAEEYKNAVQDRLSVIEGNFDCNISFIGDYIKNYIKRNSAAPVVIIDYLQILQPAVDEHGKTASTKETVDATITELKRISRSLNITIFVISSVNRANYLTPIDYESLKESGGIEYTADVIWGLQLQCLNESLFSETNKIKEKRARIKAAKAASPRQIELVCLKNRYGIANYTTCFDYVPANDLYINTGAASAEDFTDDVQRF